MLVDEGKVSLDDPVTKFIPQLEQMDGGRGKGRVACPAETSGSPRHGPARAEPHQRSHRHVRASAGHRVGQHSAESPRAQFGDRPAPMAARRQVRLRQSGHEHRRAHRGNRQRHALRGVSAKAILRSAGDDGNHLLAQRGADRPPGRRLRPEQGKERLRPGRHRLPHQAVTAIASTVFPKPAAACSPPRTTFSATA